MALCTGSQQKTGQSLSGQQKYRWPFPQSTSTSQDAIVVSVPNQPTTAKSPPSAAWVSDGASAASASLFPKLFMLLHTTILTNPTWYWRLMTLIVHLRWIFRREQCLYYRKKGLQLNWTSLKKKKILIFAEFTFAWEEAFPMRNGKENIQSF